MISRLTVIGVILVAFVATFALRAWHDGWWLRSSRPTPAPTVTATPIETPAVIPTPAPLLPAPVPAVKNDAESLPTDSIVSSQNISSVPVTEQEQPQIDSARDRSEQRSDTARSARTR